MTENFFKKKLDNGVTVIFEQRLGSGVVSVAFAVLYGGVHESPAEKGISHFIEHMLYKGTNKRSSKQISEEIEKRGGILNGFTEEEMTAYWCKMPSKHLGVALDVLSDMVKNPKFEEKELNKERLVIFEEMKMRRDTPQIYVYDKIQPLLFTGNMAYDLIGTEKTMSSITRDKILKKFKEIYSPNNIILCVVGDASFEELCGFVEKNFDRKKNKKIPIPKIGLKNKIIVEKRKGIDQANMILAYHVPKATEQEYYSAQVLNAVLAGGMSSRLFQEIREKRNLAYAVKGSCHSAKYFGYNTIYIGTSPKNIDKVKKLILEEIKKLKKLGEKEVEDAKEQLIGNSKISREDSQGQMLDLLYNEAYGDAAKSYQYEQEIKKVSLADVKKLAELKDYSIIVLIPE
ncbi:insulinase family protein [Candidatus Pacearchaeota archaeon]|nr:insulinase family protein [Candidatus Pacearchaeota archaeon]